jgi:hypothetical protein
MMSLAKNKIKSGWIHFSEALFIWAQFMVIQLKPKFTWSKKYARRAQTSDLVVNSHTL